MTSTTSSFLPSGSSISISITSVGGDNGAVAVMTDPAGNGSSTPVNLAGQPVETVTGGATPQTILNTYDGDDANMDVTALVDTTGAVVECFSYTPFGVVTVLTPAWASTTDSYNWTFMWQGGKFNSTDGLYTFGYRDYSPTLATWMEEDPTGYAAGPNVYQAMLGAPIEKTDPYGLEAGPAPSANAGSGSGYVPCASRRLQPRPQRRQYR